MALDLTMKITADASQAKRELASVEQGVQRVEQAARKSEPSLADVAKGLGVYSGATERVVQSSVKLEQTTQNLASATADQIYQQVRASTGMVELEKRIAATDVQVKALSASTMGLSVGLVAVTGYFAAAAAAGVLWLRFLYDSGRAYLEQTGQIKQLTDAVDTIKDSWHTMQVAVGAALLGNAGDISGWVGLVKLGVEQVGGYIFNYVTQTMAAIELLKGAIRSMPGGGLAMSAVALAEGAGKAANPTPFKANETYYSTTRGGYQNPFAFGPSGPVGPTRSAADALPGRGRPSRATAPYVIPTIPYAMGYQGAVPGFSYGAPNAGAFDYSTPNIPFSYGITGGLPGFSMRPSIPAGPRPGFLSTAFGGDFGAQLGSSVTGAVMGGGSILSAIGSTTGSAIGGGITGLFSKGFAASGIGKFLGGAIPFVGSLAGPLLGKLFGGLFGETQGHKDLMAANAQIADIKGGLLKDFGSAENIVALGGGDLNKGWGGQNVAGLKAFSGEVEAFRAKATGAMNDMIRAALTAGKAIPAGMQPILDSLIRQGQLTEANANLLLGLPEKGAPAFAQVSEAAKVLGVDLESIGTKIQNLRLTEQVDAAATAFETMRDANADMNAVLIQSVPKMQEFVNQALTLGLSLPESIKPWLQQMVDAGLLVDETGAKLEDLSKFSFTKPLEKSVEDLIVKLDELIEKLGGGLGGALDDIDGREVDVTVNRHVKDDPYPDDNPDGAWTGGVVRPWGIQKFGRGGRVRSFGTDTVPAMLTPGEIVLNAAQQKNVATAIAAAERPVTIRIPVIMDRQQVTEVVAKTVLRG